MATIICKCTTCKKSIEIVENIYGLTTIGKCTITEGCKGKLVKQDRNAAAIAQSGYMKAASTVTTNYSKRKTFYQREQTLRSSTWIVKHELGVEPTVFVYVNDVTTGTQKQLPKKAYTIRPIDANTIQIVFPEPTSGVVQCIARSSVPYTPSTLPSNTPMRQISTNGVLTFGIPRYLTQIAPHPTPIIADVPYDLCSGLATIRVEVEIRKPNEEPVVCFEELSNHIDIRSPWSGWQTVLVEGRRDTCIKTLPILKMKAFGNAELTKYDIPEGTRIRILRVDYGIGVPQNIPSRGLLLLLSNPPFEVIDKDRHNLVDVGELRGESNGYFVYQNGEFLLIDDLVESTYPQIERAELVILPPAPSLTPTPSVSMSQPITPTITPTMTVTPTHTRTAFPTMTPTPTVTSSHTPTPSPTTSQNAVSLDFDYAVVRFDWSEPNGTDLDIRVDIIEPGRFVIVGADRADNDGDYLFWGGDNQTAYGHEAVLVDFNQMIEDYPSEDEFRIRLRAFWYGILLDGNLRIDYISYKGGEMVRTPDNDYINVGGEVVDSKSIWVNTQEQGGLELNGEEMAYLVFDVPSNTGELVIVQPAVTPTVTPTVTMTRTPTPTITPSRTVTPTMTITPTLTPTRTANVTPSVSQTISLTPTVTRTNTRTPTQTPTATPMVSPSITPTLTPTRTVTRTVTRTRSMTPTVTVSQSISPTVTPTPENTKSATPTFTPTQTPTNTVTPTETPIVSPTPSITASITPTFTRTPTQTPTNTRTLTPTVTPSITPTITPTVTPSQAPAAMVYAGADATSLCANSVTLRGEFISSEPIENYFFLWEQLSGLPVVIDDPTALITTYTYDTSVDRTFRLWSNKGMPNQTWDDVTIYGTPSESIQAALDTQTYRQDDNVFRLTPRLELYDYNGGPITNDIWSLVFTLPVMYSIRDTGNTFDVQRLVDGTWTTIGTHPYTNNTFWAIPVPEVNATYRIKANISHKFKNGIREYYSTSVTGSNLINKTYIPITFFDEIQPNLNSTTVRQGLEITKIIYTLLRVTVEDSITTTTGNDAIVTQGVSVVKYDYKLLPVTVEEEILSNGNSKVDAQNNTINRYSGGVIGS